MMSYPRSTRTIPLKMPCFALYFFTALDLALVVWGGQVHPARLPDLPPPPTFTPAVVNNSLTLIIGGSATVREDKRVTIDCQPLITEVVNKGVPNPRVTWYKNGIILTNGSERNIFISKDSRFCIITETALSRGGELGTSGNYTCRVCDGDGTNCINDTSSKIVCGIPHLVPPTVPPIVQPTFITLTCGQDVTVPTLVGVSSIIISCQIFNGTDPLTTTVYKDGTMIVGNSVPYIIANPTDNDFGTYTVVASSEHCGAAHAVSRILQEGVPPNIDEGPFVPIPRVVTKGTKRVNVGSPVYVLSGFDVIIDCNIINGTPPINILWLRNNEVINSSVGNSSTITITDAEDGDVFTCRASNNIGFDEANSIINVQGNRCSGISSIKDVVFVIDTSGSIDSSRFQLIREFTANITSELMLDSPKSAVGVILFNNTAHIEFNLQAHTNLSALLTAINQLPYSGGGTDTAEALTLLRSTAQNGELGLRNDSSKVAIVITDGRSNNQSATSLAAVELHNSDIFDVYAVGIGGANQDELRRIASSPEFVFFSTSFSITSLQQIKDRNLPQFCIGVPPDIDEGPFVPIPRVVIKGTKRVNVGSPVYVFSGSDVIIDCNIINGTPPINILWLRNNEVINSSIGNSSTITITDAEDGDVFICRASNNIGFDEANSIINVQGNRCSGISSIKDVVFVIDTSGSIGSSRFQLIREFTANITSELMLDSPKSAVGVILFNSTAHIQFNLQAHTNLSALLPAINELPYMGGNTNTAEALYLLLSTAKNEGFGLRNDSSKVAIVITDGKSNFPSATLSAADELHASNIFDVFAVGIDRANLTELQRIASSPELVIFTNTFNSTGLQQLKEKILLQLCIDVDINECLTNNGGCDHVCESSQGSFQCSCNTSYVLAPDNKTCISNNTDCVYMLNEPSGSINTDGFPNSSYSLNSNCTWIIDLPAYKSIELKFVEIAIEESSDCVKDRVIILNGKDENALSLGSYCGNKLPTIIKSSTQAVTIRFISDDTVNGKGFNLQYKGLTERPKGIYECSIIIQSINTTIALPSFPSKYSNPINCVYYLQSLMSRVKLTFLYLDILAADCNTDRIEIYEGISTDVPSRIICNGNRVVEFVSSSDIIKMEYIGNSVNKYQGFHALVTFL